MNSFFNVHTIGGVSVVEFRTNSLMDPIVLEEVGQSLYRLVDEEDRRKLVLDFEKVEYLSSQAIGIVLTLHKKLGALKNSQFVLCSINAKLQELMRITRLDKVLTVKPTQREAMKAFSGALV